MNERITTVILLISAVLFTFFAALQYNDPDPFIWIAAYMFVAILSVISLYKNISPYILLPFILIYLTAAAYLWPQTYMGVTMPMSYKTEIELARESLGLIIAAFSMCGIGALTYFRTKKLKTINQTAK